MFTYETLGGVYMWHVHHAAPIGCAGSPAEQTATLLRVAGDWVAEALDKELGAAVTDPSIYRAHAEKYEVSKRGDWG